MLNFIHTIATRWDSNSYIFLSQNGYVSTGPFAVSIVFPPFYPFLIRIFTFFLRNPEVSAISISAISIALAVLMFYKLLRLDYKKSKAIWTTVTLVIFPTSYFFLAAYPESLFILLTISAFYFSRKKNFLLASLFGGLAALTRPFGVLMWPVLFIEWWLDKKRKWLDLLVIVSFLILSSSIYLSLNYFLFGNPFAFQDFLKNHWQKSFSFPWIGIISSWQRGIQTPDTNVEYKYLVGYAEALASTTPYIFILLNIFFKRIRMRLSYLVYFILAVLLMTSTGFLLSTPRYLLSIPPFFITLGSLTNNKVVKVLWVFVSLSLLIYLSLLFVKGHWAF